MSTREEQKEQTRQKILTKTIEMVMDPEFTSLNTNELAENAGVSKGLIFHHFQSKDLLLLTAVEQIFTQAFDNTLGNHIHHEKDDPADLLRMLTRENLQLVVEHQNLTIVLIQLIADFKHKRNLRALDDFAKNLLLKTMAPLSHIFKDLGWQEEDLEITIQLFLSILDGLGLDVYIGKQLPSGNILALDIEKTTDLIVRLFDKR